MFSRAMRFLCPPSRTPWCQRERESLFPLNEFVQEGEFYAHSAASGFTSLIPKTFLNQSFLLVVTRYNRTLLIGVASSEIHTFTVLPKK